jgi:hypothetical protein
MATCKCGIVITYPPEETTCPFCKAGKEQKLKDVEEFI